MADETETTAALVARVRALSVQITEGGVLPVADMLWLFGEVPQLLAAYDAAEAERDALRAERDRLAAIPASDVTDAPLTLKGIRRDGAQVIVEVGHEAEALLAERNALRTAYETLTTQLGEAWLEYGALLNGRRADDRDLARITAELAALKHELGKCDATCSLDHEPREPSGGVACPAGCTTTMVPDYVETHLTMCPAVLTRITAERDALRAERDRLQRLRDFDTSTVPLPKGLQLEYLRLDEMWQKLVRERDAACSDLTRITAQRDRAVAVVEAARRVLAHLEFQHGLLAEDDPYWADAVQCDDNDAVLICEAHLGLRAALAAATAGAPAAEPGQGTEGAC